MKLRPITRPQIPASAKGCFNVQVARNAVPGKHHTEVLEFIMRPAHEVRGIIGTFGPGSKAHRKEGWRVTSLEPAACRTGGLGRARRRRRKR